MLIPNAVVLDSCDYAQTMSLTKQVAKVPGLTYTRLIRKAFKTIYKDGSEFEIGKGVTLKDGSDVTLISSGFLLDEALKASEILAEKNISARVIDMTPGGIFDACNAEITTWGRADLDTLDDANVGLNGSPTKIARASDKVKKGAGEIVNLDADASVDYIMGKLDEKHII